MLRTRKDSAQASWTANSSGGFASSRSYRRNDAGKANPTFSVDLQEDTKLGRIDDVQYQEVKLYIEGVNVPFQSINITQSYMQKPMASISIPPAAGLTEIGRNYFPKVHIFFRDIHHERYLKTNNIEYEDKHVMKLLFDGVIHQTSYTKSSASTGAYANITFNCMHRDYVTDEVLIKYGGRGMEAFRVGTGIDEGDVTAQVSLFSSQQASLKALEGIRWQDDPETGIAGKIDIDTFINQVRNRQKSEEDIGEVDPSLLSSRLNAIDKEHELKGIPSIMLILWQIIKTDSYRFEESLTHAMRKLYIPLIDEGLAYFKRMSGHRVIEEELNSDKYKLADTIIEKYKTSESEGIGDVNYIQMPPAFRTFLGRALSSDIAIKLVQTLTAGATETMTLEQVFMQLMHVIRYDKITLASPVQSVQEGALGIDKIVKPLLPFYYSPVCNVFLPNLYDNLSVSENCYATPTRVRTKNQGPILGQAESVGLLEYRAPHDIRKALAYANYLIYSSATSDKDKRTAAGLDFSLFHRGEVAGVHELGQGIRNKTLPTMDWLNNLNAAYEQEELEDPELSAADAADEEKLNRLIESWALKYSTEPSTLNPWEERDANGLYAYQRNIINTLEYDYALSTVETRVGSLNGVFNPYVIPGYPCDIIDPSPDRPSYHAFVVSATHSITAGSINTTVAFSSALSYEEMQSYDMPPVVPWLREQLGLHKANILDQSESTKAIASDYYRDILGVGFADPSYLYDFARGTGRPVTLNTYYGDFAERAKGESKLIDSGTKDLYSTVEGNLMMVRREIESMADLERINLEFVDIPAQMEANSTSPQQEDSGKLTEEERKNEEVFYQKAADIGRSIFLEYPRDISDGIDLYAEVFDEVSPGPTEGTS